MHAEPALAWPSVRRPALLAMAAAGLLVLLSLVPAFGPWALIVRV